METEKAWTKEDYIKNTIKWLKMYNSLKVSVENMEDDIKRIQKDDRGCTITIQLDREPISRTYKFNSVVENEAIDNVDLIYLLRNKIEITKFTLRKIERALNVLPEREKKLIEMRYISEKYYTWRDIANALGYTVDHCRGYLRKQALVKISVAIYGLDALEDIS